MKKREKYEEFLKKVDLLQSMDPYERVKIGDAVKTEIFKKGDFIVKQVKENKLIIYLKNSCIFFFS